jgi:hypothetical protein
MGELSRYATEQAILMDNSLAARQARHDARQAESDERAREFVAAMQKRGVPALPFYIGHTISTGGPNNGPSDGWVLKGEGWFVLPYTGGYKSRSVLLQDAETYKCSDLAENAALGQHIPYFIGSQAVDSVAPEIAPYAGDHGRNLLIEAGREQGLWR